MIESKENSYKRKIKKFRVSETRRNLKLKAIKYKGGKCIKCGFDSCPTAMAFHHTDPSKKDFNLAAKGTTRSFDKIKKELDKCVLLCLNCHAEEHHIQYQLDRQILIADLLANSDFKIPTVFVKVEKQFKNCTFCNKLTSINNKYCSRSCAAASQLKIDWSSVDLLEELKIKSMLQLGKELGVSSNAIKKRLKKIGLFDTVKKIRLIKHSGP
jgi:hypothetical protein